MRRNHLVWLALVSLGIMLAGCYTVIVHPKTSGMTTESPRHCSDCHNSADYYYWHFPYLDTWYWRYPYWRSYYCRPWWWDDYWWWDDSETPKWESPHYYEKRNRPAQPGLPGGAIGTKKTKEQVQDERAVGKSKGESKKDSVPHYQRDRQRPKPEQPRQPKKRKQKSKEEN